jgi:hypothetical protein
MVDENTEERQGIGETLRRHPYLVATFVICIGLGAALGAIYMPAEWSSARRLFGGAFAGAGVAVFLTVTRLFAVLE